MKKNIFPCCIEVKLNLGEVTVIMVRSLVGRKLWCWLVLVLFGVVSGAGAGAETGADAGAGAGAGAETRADAKDGTSTGDEGSAGACAGLDLVPRS